MASADLVTRIAVKLSLQISERPINGLRYDIAMTTRYYMILLYMDDRTCSQFPTREACQASNIAFYMKHSQMEQEQKEREERKEET